MMTSSLVIMIVGIGFSLWGLWAMERATDLVAGTGFLRLTLGANGLVFGAIGIVVSKVFGGFY
jgi:hypothetical protein